MLRVENLTKSFGGVAAVSQVSFDVDEGAVVTDEVAVGAFDAHAGEASDDWVGYPSTRTALVLSCDTTAARVGFRNPAGLNPDRACALLRHNRGPR